MRLAIFTDTFMPQVNGVSQALDKLVSYLRKNNLPTIIFAPGQNALQFENYNLCSISSFNMPVYPEYKVGLPRYDLVSKKLKEFAPDLIHLATPFTIGLCGLKLAKKMSIPCIASYHTDFPGYLNYYRLGVLKRLSWQYIKWFHNQCSSNFCPSSESQKALKVNGINKVKIWGNGVDSELFNPKKFNLTLRSKYVPEDKIAFLYVGRLAPEKNLNMLLKSFKQVNASYPEAHLVITGDGPSYNYLKKEAPQGVSFTGYLLGNDLAEIYASCDVFVFPSATETYGLVILEAMASELPVIAAYAGGVKENIIHNYNGLACIPLDQNDLTSKMKTIISDTTLRDKLSQNARHYATQKSWDHIFNDMVMNYHTIVSQKHLA